jgi:hypothetical protein
MTVGAVAGLWITPGVMIPLHGAASLILRLIGPPVADHAPPAVPVSRRV